MKEQSRRRLVIWIVLIGIYYGAACVSSFVEFAYPNNNAAATSMLCITAGGPCLAFAFLIWLSSVLFLVARRKNLHGFPVGDSPSADSSASKQNPRKKDCRS